MNIFSKETSEVAQDIISNFIEHNIQPVMLEINEQGYLQKAAVHQSHEYNETWMFVASYKSKRYCSYWELADMLADYGLDIQLLPDEPAKIIAADDELSLSA